MNHACNQFPVEVCGDGFVRSFIIHLIGFQAFLVEATFELDAEEEADVVAFLKSLTDRTFVSDPRFAAPDPSR